MINNRSTEDNDKLDDVCRECGDSGVIIKTEWTDTDTSYEVELPCVCRED